MLRNIISMQVVHHSDCLFSACKPVLNLLHAGKEYLVLSLHQASPQDESNIPLMNGHPLKPYYLPPGQMLKGCLNACVLYEFVLL